ncbi:hypothetical protein QOT17_002751 [Balamuthia mandrillaris]
MQRPRCTLLLWSGETAAKRVSMIGSTASSALLYSSARSRFASSLLGSRAAPPPLSLVSSPRTHHKLFSLSPPRHFSSSSASSPKNTTRTTIDAEFIDLSSQEAQTMREQLRKATGGAGLGEAGLPWYRRLQQNYGSLFQIFLLSSLLALNYKLVRMRGEREEEYVEYRANLENKDNEIRRLRQQLEEAQQQQHAPKEQQQPKQEERKKTTAEEKKKEERRVEEGGKQDPFEDEVTVV